MREINLIRGFKIKCHEHRNFLKNKIKSKISIEFSKNYNIMGNFNVIKQILKIKSMNTCQVCGIILIKDYPKIGSIYSNK